MKNAVQTSGQSITSIYYMPVILPRYMADKSDIPSEGQAEPQKVQDNNEASDESEMQVCKCGHCTACTFQYHPDKGVRELLALGVL